MVLRGARGANQSNCAKNRRATCPSVRAPDEGIGGDA
jgi:hypothetical protein